jgi:hypothetical protein
MRINMGAGIARWYRDYTAGRKTKGSQTAGRTDIVLLQSVQTVSGATQPPIQWVTRFVPGNTAVGA